MNINVASSIVEIGGRTFPACVLVCPPYGDNDHTTEQERVLGGRGGGTKLVPAFSDYIYVPCENGILVEIEQAQDQLGYEVTLRCPTCSPVLSDALPIFIPETVALVGHRPVAQPRPHRQGITTWRNGEGEWVAELIERVSKMEFFIPPGPRVTLKPLSFCYSDVVS